MPEIAAKVTEDWLEALAKRYAEATEDEQETVRNRIAKQHGAAAGALVRELFAAQRANRRVPPAEPDSAATAKADPLAAFRAERAVREARMAEQANAEAQKAAARASELVAKAAPKLPKAEPAQAQAEAPLVKHQPETAAEPASLIVLAEAREVEERKAEPGPQQALKALNEQHAVIDNVGGKTVIASWEPSQLDPTRQELVYQKSADFLLRYSNRSVLIDVPNKRGGYNTETLELGRWWLKHLDRRQYRGVTFLPGGPQVVDGCLNLWSGWGVLAVQGDWSLIRAHIVEVIAGGNAVFAEYVIRWIAWAIQNPDKQAEVALVLIGEKGAGKGTLARVLQRIFGRHAFQTQSSEHVIGRFNGHLQDCVLFIPDEAQWSDDAVRHKCAGKLQGYITEPTLPIELKGIDLFQVRNRLHVMMLAEPGWVIPAGRHERRYAALEVSKARLRDKPYFTALHSQINVNGAEAMLYDLQCMDLEGWHPRDLPVSLLKSKALQEQQVRTLPLLAQWYFGLLHAGVLPGAVPNHPNRSRAKSLREDAGAKFPRLKFDLSDRGLTDFLKDNERIGIAFELKSTAQYNAWAAPPLAECRAAWEQLYGSTVWERPAEEWGWKPPTVPKALAQPQPPAAIAPAPSPRGFDRRL